MADFRLQRGVSSNSFTKYRRYTQLCLCSFLFTLVHEKAVADTIALGIGTPKYPESIAYDMNAAGQVAAVVEDEKGGQHAVFFQKGKSVVLDTPDATESQAKRINDKGEIVGFIIKKGGISRAFLYSPITGLQELGTLGGSSSQGMALNDKGAVVGFADTPNGDWHAFLSLPFKPLKDLGTFGGKISYAHGVNNAGQVVGTATIQDGSSHAFLYDPLRGLVDLGTLGGRNSKANAINDKGIVVGASEMKDYSWHAFIHDGKHMLDLGAMIGVGNSFATSINNAGEVVGIVDISNGRYGDLRESFVWRNHKLLLHGSGKGLFLANAINDKGQIIGATYDHDGFHAAAMQSNTVPYVDVGGAKIIVANIVALVLAGTAVIFRKRFTGLTFRN